MVGIAEPVPQGRPTPTPSRGSVGRGGDLHRPRGPADLAGRCGVLGAAHDQRLAALPADGGAAGGRPRGPGGDRDQGHRRDSGTGGRRGSPEPGVRRCHHRPAAPAGAGRPDRRRCQRADRVAGQEFIASDAFADFWVTANTRAQAALVRLLQGDDTGAISLQGDQVVLDVSQVIEQVKQRLVARGLTFVETGSRSRTKTGRSC